MSILPNISISNDALDKGMVRRPDPEEHGPERGQNPFEYDKGTHSFAMHKISNNPRNQLINQPIILPNPVVTKGIDPFTNRVPTARIEPIKLKVVGIWKTDTQNGGPR